MLEQIFGRNRSRMVEAVEIRRTEAGTVVEGFTAFTLHGDRWFAEAEWKPRSREEALTWLNGGVARSSPEPASVSAGAYRAVQEHVSRQGDPVT